MIKRLLSVLCFTLLLLALASVATTSAAPQAGSFGQVIKPGFVTTPPALLTQYQQRYGIGWGGSNSVLRFSVANANRSGVLGFPSSMIGRRTLYNSTANTDCATTPSRYKNAATLSGLSYPNGLHYVPNTITNINSLTPTFVYTPVAPFWPAIYSPTFDYRPQAIGCYGTEGIMPPDPVPTKMWQSIYSSP